MTVRSQQLGILIASVLLLSAGSACKKKTTNGVMIFANGFLTVVSTKVNDDGSLANPTDPGWIVLFRTTGRMPTEPDGKLEGPEGARLVRRTESMITSNWLRFANLIGRKQMLSWGMSSNKVWRNYA